MYITDNKGKQIEVTNLDAAIKQVAVFVSYAHQDNEFKTIDKELRVYWKDIQHQLLIIKEATTDVLQLPHSTNPDKAKWMKDFLGTREEVTNSQEIKEFLQFYAASEDWETTPDVLYVFEGSYFIIMKEGVFRINYNDHPREFHFFNDALQYLAELEWQDSKGELNITLDPSCTLIESVTTEYTGGNIYNDVIVLKDATTIRISEGMIAVFKDKTETEKTGEIYY